MELSLERKPITVNETILDINTEQAVESDMLLADYYPRDQPDPALLCGDLGGSGGGERRATDRGWSGTLPGVL